MSKIETNIIDTVSGTTNLTIGSTAGLSGAAISGVAYHVSQAPKYTVQDSSFSAVNETAAGINTLGFIGTASTAVGIGTSACLLVVLQCLKSVCFPKPFF